MGSKSKNKINVMRELRVHPISNVESGIVFRDCERVFESIEQDEDYFDIYVLPFAKKIEKRKTLAKKNSYDETEGYKKNKVNHNEGTRLRNRTLGDSNSSVSTKDLDDFKVPPIPAPKPKKPNKKKTQQIAGKKDLEEPKTESNKIRSRSVCYPEKPKTPELGFRSLQIRRRKLYNAEEWLDSVEFDNQFKQN